MIVCGGERARLALDVVPEEPRALREAAVARAVEAADHLQSERARVDAARVGVDARHQVRAGALAADGVPRARAVEVGHRPQPRVLRADVHAPSERRAHIGAEQLVLWRAVKVGDEAFGEGEDHVDLARAQSLRHRASAARKIRPLHLQPGGLKEAFRCRGVPWCVVAAGPPTAEQVSAFWSNLQNLHPKASIVASSLDAFAEEVLRGNMAELQTVTEELGDSWLYGAPADPIKVATFRCVEFMKRSHRWRFGHHGLVMRMFCQSLQEIFDDSMCNLNTCSFPQLQA